MVCHGLAMEAIPMETLLDRGRLRKRGLPAPPVRRLIREQAGLSQLDLAAYLGVSRPSVTRYENGRRTPRGALLERYRDLLDRLTRES